MRFKSSGLIVIRVPGEGASLMNTKDKHPHRSYLGSGHNEYTSPRTGLGHHQQERKADTLNLKTESTRLGGREVVTSKVTRNNSLTAHRRGKDSSKEGRTYLHESGHSKGSLCI